MYVIVEEGPAIFVLVVAGILLGTFPVAFNWVELHGRKPAHTFLDFSLAFMLTAVPCSLALSCTGPKWVFAPGFLIQLSQDNGFLVFCACLAGVFLMLGSMCLQYGLAYAGLALCLPYQIAISISVGVGIDWLIDMRLARAPLLWAGLLCFSAATFLGTLAHVARLKGLKALRDRSAVGKVVSLDDLLSQRQRMAMMDSARPGDVEVVSLASSSGSSSCSSPTKPSEGLPKHDSAGPPDVILDLESPAKVTRRALSLRQAGTAVMQDANAFADEEEAGTPKADKPQFPVRAQYCVRAIDVTGSKPLAGLVVLTLGGLCFGVLTPLFFVATSSLPATDRWRILPDGTPPLTVYNAFFFMACTFFFTSWGSNLSLLYQPLLEGDESSLTGYCLDWHGRLASCGAGIACGLGMALQFMGGLGGGYYVAELVKLYPLLAAAWGVGLFRELRGVGRRAALLLASTCGTYVLGVLLLAFARNHSSV